MVAAVSKMDFGRAPSSSREGPLLLAGADMGICSCWGFSCEFGPFWFYWSGDEGTSVMCVFFSFFLQSFYEEVKVCEFLSFMTLESLALASCGDNYVLIYRQKS